MCIMPSFLVVFAIYAISWVFVFATGIINYGIGINSSRGVCSAAIQLFLFCYLVMKVTIVSLLTPFPYIVLTYA